MKTRPRGARAAVALFAAVVAGSAAAAAQTTEVKEKPPLYTYVASWTFPRAKWADVQKQNAGTQKVLDKALSGGGLVAYGDDTMLIHSSDGYTHDTFWSGMSLAGVLGALEELEKGGANTNAALASATKHEDALLVSHYYNWKAGPLQGAYTHEAEYSLKDSAPDDAVDIISKSFGVPLFEKLLADGTILEYEIDQEQIHTESPAKFWVVYITKNAEGLDKVGPALDAAFGASPFIGPALDSMVDSSKHRDYLARTNGVYK
jgi:hypothetical protein